MIDFQEKYYDSKNYFHEPEIPLRIKKAIVLLSQNLAGKSLLDIGCNDGQISSFFLKSGYDVMGVDISAKALSIAKNLGIKTVKSNILERLPFLDNTFDVVFCGEILEHVLEPVNAIKEGYRVLKPNGFFVVTVPNVSSLGNAVLILNGSLPAYSCTFDGPHVRDYCKKELLRLLKTVNFSSLSIIGDQISLPIYSGKRIKIPNFSNRLCDYLIAFCKK